MLTNCPECAGKISDKCTICVHCGFPFKECLEYHKEHPMEIYYHGRWGNMTSIYNKVMELKKEFGVPTVNGLNKEQLEKLNNFDVVRQVNGTIFERLSATEVNQFIYNTGKVPAFFVRKISDGHTATTPTQTYTATAPTQTQIKCPHCGSTNIKKIGTLSRAGSVGMFGLASSKVGKQWHCNNCKSDF